MPTLIGNYGEFKIMKNESRIVNNYQLSSFNFQVNLNFLIII